MPKGAFLSYLPLASLLDRKLRPAPLFLAGFAILFLRGFLYPLSDDRLWLFAVQSLDGVGAGLYGALFTLIVADVTRGTGHFNLGAAVSPSLAWLVVVHAGFSAPFLF